MPEDKTPDMHDPELQKMHQETQRLLALGDLPALVRMLSEDKESCLARIQDMMDGD